MKNKKIVVCLLIAVMVLGLTLTTLVGCKGFKDVEYDKMSEFLNQAIENTAEGKNINDMKLGALLTIDTTYGDSKKTYTVDIAASLALAEKSTNKNEASLEIKDSTGKNVISAYYYEPDPNVDPYLYLKLGENKYTVNAVHIREILKKNNAYLGDKTAGEINTKVTGGLSSFLSTLGMIAQIEGVQTQVARNGKSYRLALNVGQLLGGELIDTFAGGLQTTIDELGIALDMKKLNEVLPAIELGININVSNKKAEKAVITGITADLSCAKKDVVINKTGDKGSLLELSIKNDFKAKADIQLKFGEDVTVVHPSDLSSYTNFIGGAIDLSATGTFTIDADIKNVNVFDILTINIDKGTYNLNVAIKADPAVLVDLDFTKIHCTPHAIAAAIDAMNNALDYLNLEITKADKSEFLQVELGKNETGNVVFKNLKLSGIGLSGDWAGLVDMVAKSNLSLKDVWSTAAGFIFKADDDYANCGVDAGYKLVSAGTDLKFKYQYKVDTAAGYVDDNNDNEPDRDTNGNFVVGKDFALDRNGRPAPKEYCGYKKDASGNWVVDIEAGYTDDNGNPAKDSNGEFVVGKDFELYKHQPLHKSECGYIQKDGKWVVNEEAGYVKASSKVKFDSNGDFAVAEGYVLFQKDGDARKIPYKKTDLTQEELDSIPKAEEGTVPQAVKDLIDGLKIVAKAGKITVNIGGMSFGEEGKKITLTANLGADKNGIEVGATLGGLNNAMEGLPALLNVLINIQFSDIKYGAIGND